MPGQPVTVLLVEDNYIDADLIMLVFERLKIPNPVLLARDGQDALDLLRGANDHDALARPYLILLDYNLPGMNGAEFLEALAADSELKESIVYMMVTDSDDTYRFAAYDGQLAGYLVKDNIGQEFLALPEEIRTA